MEVLRVASNINLKAKVKLSLICTIFYIFCLGVLCEESVAVANETDIYFKIESFTWKEYSDSGSQLLEESGPIYGLGCSSRSDIAQSLILWSKFEIFGGSVDYDGQTQEGTPANSDTDYTGLMVEGGIGIKAKITETIILEPFAGLGYRWWLRDIKSTYNAIGYEERWQSFYIQLGIRSEDYISDQLKSFALLGVKYPIRNENEIGFSQFGYSDITVKPGNKASFFAEIGLKKKNFMVSFFYEGLRFSKSDVGYIYDAYGVYGIYQPESEADIFGVNIGITF
jgi:hypothetical protein